jgi:hypothetical protein
MNDRIKELESMCWTDTSPEWAENIRMEFNIEKFAELLIKECAEVYRNNVTLNRSLYPTEFSTALIEHFGIK